MGVSRLRVVRDADHTVQAKTNEVIRNTEYVHGTVASKIAMAYKKDIHKMTFTFSFVGDLTP